MKSILRGSCLCGAVVLLTVMPVAWAESGGKVSIEGRINCTLTGAEFPTRVGQPLLVTYSGTMELVADGAGKFLSGHMTTKAAGDGATIRGAKPCHFNLMQGGYALNDDGTGRSETSWAYWEGGGSTLSDQLCSDNVFHPQHFEGLDLNNMRKERTHVLEAFLVPSLPAAMLYWVGMDETGLTVAVCKREAPIRDGK